MTTFEVKNMKALQRKFFRERPMVTEIEVLDSVHTNVVCEDEYADDVEEMLEDEGLEFRLV